MEICFTPRALFKHLYPQVQLYAGTFLSLKEWLQSVSTHTLRDLDPGLVSASTHLLAAIHPECPVIQKKPAAFWLELEFSVDLKEGFDANEPLGTGEGKNGTLQLEVTWFPPWPLQTLLATGAKNQVLCWSSHTKSFDPSENPTPCPLRKF